MNSINESGHINFYNFRNVFTQENMVDIMGFTPKNATAIFVPSFAHQVGKESDNPQCIDKHQCFYMNGLDYHLKRSFLGLLEDLLIFDIRRFISIQLVEK